MTRLLRCILPALFLLLLIGLQSAFSCQVPSYSQSRVKSIQVNTCHFDAGITAAQVCCDSAVCHRNSTPVRHLGSPEYANQIKDLLPLILESRQHVPQPKSAPTFEQRLGNPRPAPLVFVTSQAPSLTLTLLGTVVLLH